ncbi:uncharacterized protein [Triticum aestivum]|uniref:uncharacterized protein n=1 Tax=Triticum aestivum TaxID=4565 RepID=UPI001D002C6D|nr:uncharacterized protein LOC123158326 [Triticum aestivum]
MSTLRQQLNIQQSTLHLCGPHTAYTAQSSSFCVGPTLDFLTKTTMLTSICPIQVACVSACNGCTASTSGRRRRVPAFGEWNNHSDGDEGGWTAAVVNQCFEPVTAQKSLKQEFIGYDSGVVVMGKQQHKVTRQTWVDDSGTHMAMEPFSFTAVKAVDDDLYEVPSDMLCAKPLREVLYIERN